MDESNYVLRLTVAEDIEVVRQNLQHYKMPLEALIDGKLSITANEKEAGPSYIYLSISDQNNILLSVKPLKEIVLNSADLITQLKVNAMANEKYVKIKDGNARLYGKPNRFVNPLPNLQPGPSSILVAAAPPNEITSEFAPNDDFICERCGMVLHELEMIDHMLIKCVK